MMLKKSNKSALLILILVLLLLFLITFIYLKNSTVIDKFPNVTGKQPEPVTTTSQELKSIPSQITSSTIITSDYETIKVGAFNIKMFGTTKAGKPEVMEVLSKIIRNYDIIAIQEIRGDSQTALPALIYTVNSAGNPQYNFIVSESLGETKHTARSKERYAYFYNTQTIQLTGSSYKYPNSNALFQREPYVSEFKAKNGNFDFVLITIHIDPDNATQEINEMPKVVEDARNRYQGESDFIIIGDLNADCSYFNENSPSSLQTSDYYWIINNSVDTTTIEPINCTYDRIIITTSSLTDFTGESGVFRFDTAYNLSYISTMAVSDHYPVYANFWSNRDTD
ncbi:MAG TPA: endonuclease/exonuclease/phosphatase family protein [Candidatus Methanoperedens sp.]|nr:endonuclease/exonuclease/phosphatase family protein [Candidatus Methanoperedens sp.]